ncbi:MAG: DUF6390 family protein [Thermoplasmata archaeon]|nr:DUF6390 family protein [Thermoplasmata archaeon]
MDGVQLGARFSIATNRLQFCGPADAEPVLYRAITRGERLDEARQSLARFEALMPYLEAIGGRHGLDPFDARVVEAYWIGNELLDDFEKKEFVALLGALVRRGLPRAVARRLVEHLPERPLPHHMFHVAFVGVGSVTGHVPTTLPNMEACRPSWGRVTVIEDSTLHVESPELAVAAGRLQLGPARSVRLPYDPAVAGTPGVGDAVAFHWGCVALALSPERTEALRRYTDRSIASANEVLPDLHVL